MQFSIYIKSCFFSLVIAFRLEISCPDPICKHCSRLIQLKAMYIIKAIKAGFKSKNTML